MEGKRLDLPAVRLPASTRALREEVRAFLRDELADYPAHLRAKSWLAFDPDFSRKVAARGWVGMAWPTAHGGGGRSLLERYVVIEEMLAAGAPVAAHWTGDRQSGPMLIMHGTEQQRRRFLPALRKAEIFFCIGMSESDAGSDLASVRTRGRRVDGGWSVSGAKLWTSNAHRSDYMIALVRTADLSEGKHAGLSQFLIDMSSKGITTRPIRDLTGEDHFNEVVLDEVFVPDDMVIGKPGEGWAQVTSELALERSGPERFMSSLPLLFAAIPMLKARGYRGPAFGRLVAHLMTLRQMSVAVATMLDAGDRTPALEAALVKDLGMDFEQMVPSVLEDLLDVEPRLLESEDLARMLGMVTTLAPSYSIRGGTREILRGIIAKGVGGR
jgi:acyl-CoA dehydrogenase